MELFLIFGIITTLLVSSYLYMAYFKKPDIDDDCPLQRMLNERAEFII